MWKTEVSDVFRQPFFDWLLYELSTATRSFRFRLILNNNRLYTLPETIHYLTELDTLHLEDNPELTMPAKPPELNPKIDEFYNIDFNRKSQPHL